MGQFDVLTKYIPPIEQNQFGTWITDKKTNGTPIQLPYVVYSETIKNFVRDVYKLIDERKDLKLTQHKDILEKNNIRSIETADVSGMDEQCVLALIVMGIRTDRFSEGTLLKLFEEGYITQWLKRLKEIDCS